MACLLSLVGFTGGAGESPDALVDVQSIDPEVVLDIRYATADNLAHRKLYPTARCLLRREVAQKVHGAQTQLSQLHPGMRLLLKDCYRPLSVQRQLFAVVQGTPGEGYVANPSNVRGAVHTYGAAVDVTLVDAAGHELDMGTPYDFLGPLAEPRREPAFLAAGKLTQQQLDNRQILRTALLTGGRFRPIPNEWWHFDAWQGAALRARYKRLDVPLVPP